MSSMWKIMLFFYLKPHKHCITPNNVIFLQRHMTPLIPNYRMKFISLVNKIDYTTTKAAKTLLISHFT